MFSVYKPHDAMAELRAAWERCDDGARARIGAAMLELERRLQGGPTEQGESREGGTRVLFHFPLAVSFEIDVERRLVRVLRAWTFRRAA
jgi:hypothetical protein